jgi:serine protease inhibitor
VQLSIANSIWTNQNIAIKTDFLSRNQRFYKAKVESLDFSDRQSVKTINNWVKRNTQGKIDSIVEQLTAADQLILVNATYFKGQWSQAFKPELTTPQPFTTPDGKKTVQMMSQRGSYRYLETDELQAIALPYGERQQGQHQQGQRLHLYLLLPKENQSMTDLISKFTQNTDNWANTFSSNFRSNPGRIQLPRIKMESKLELQQPLTTLGMGNVFTPTANFTQLSNRPTQVDRILHKTFVEINESGTEAAAATSIGIRSTSVERLLKPFDLKLDRPFLCILKDDQTGAILFMGAIVNP